MTSTSKVYCKIIDYLDAKYPTLAQHMRSLCLDATLGATRGRPGITFVIPSDETIKKVGDLLAGVKSDADNKSIYEAADMLSAHIFLDLLKEAKDWTDHGDDLPNALRQSMKCKALTKGQIGIIHKSKEVAVIAKEEAFIDSSSRKDASGNRQPGLLSVWKVVGSGVIPVTTDVPTTFKHTSKKPGAKPGAKSGAYEITQDHERSLRNLIATLVSNAYAAHKTQGDTGFLLGGDHVKGYNAAGKSRQYRDIYLEYSMSLVHYICKNYPELYYDKVLPVISFHKVDFYNLLEPNRPPVDENMFLIPSSVVLDWWNEGKPCDTKEVINAIGRHLDNAPAEYKKYAVYSRRSDLITETNKIRGEIMNQMLSRPREAPLMIRNAYQQLENNNSIGSVTDVFPKGLHEYYRANPGLKMSQDELRYLTFLQFESLEREPTFDINRLSTIVGLISEVQHALSAEARERTNKLLNATTLRYLIQPTERVNEITIFVNSTNLLYFPITPADCKHEGFRNVITRPEPSDLQVWSIENSYVSRHMKWAASTDTRALDLIDELSKYKSPSEMPPALKAKIEEVYSLFRGEAPAGKV